MKGLWLENKQLQLVTDVSIPEPKAGEVLVRVLSAGICNTDLELVRGYYPYRGILGHEFVGIVEEGPEHLINQRVVGEINASCGSCNYCLKGQKNHCQNRSVLGIVNLNGAFAQYLALPVENLHLVPSSVSNEIATFTEPLAAALQIQEQISIEKDYKVLVVGDGKLGQLIAQSLSLISCDLLVVGRHIEKLNKLKNRGIKTSLSNNIKPKSFDVAIDCTGHSDGFAVALDSLCPRGTLILKSTYAGNLNFNASSIVVDEIKVIGSRCGPFAPALDLLAQGKIDVNPLIDCSYPLTQGIEAFNHAQTKGTLKILLEVSKD
jgi:threonine dehydrogenase-like Zn-dependent dehydrogenase